LEKLLLAFGEIIARVWRNYCLRLEKLLLAFGEIIARVWRNYCLRLEKLLLAFGEIIGFFQLASKMLALLIVHLRYLN
jgi:hypothetical protein